MEGRVPFSHSVCLLDPPRPHSPEGSSDFRVAGRCVNTDTCTPSGDGFQLHLLLTGLLPPLSLSLHICKVRTGYEAYI